MAETWKSLRKTLKFEIFTKLLEKMNITHQKMKTTQIR